MIKYSKQRECIINNLRSRRDHPTADMVYESVRMEQPNISLGTVYRNLSLLADQGQILKISTGAGPDHFDGFTDPHIHFVCRYCGGVSDVEGNVEMKWIEEDKVSFRGEVEGYDIQVFGKCDQCLSIKTN